VPQCPPAPLPPASSRLTPGRGMLRVQVLAAEGVYPVCGARVAVFQSVNGRHRLFHDRRSDAEGFVEDLPLPAPRMEEADRRNTRGTAYNVLVEHPGFLRAVFTQITVYDGVESIKPVFLVPKTAGMREPPEVVFEKKE